jgi:hypothetical protein
MRIAPVHLGNDTFEDHRLVSVELRGKRVMSGDGNLQQQRCDGRQERAGYRSHDSSMTASS